MTAAFLPTSRAEMLERGWDHSTSSRERRRLRRSPLLRHGHHHATARGPRLPCRRHRAARLARSGVRHHARRTAPGLPRLGWQHGLDGQPLHGREEAPPPSDAYSPGGKAGLRPDHACVVYGNLIRRTYKKTPIILGGIEASLRRLAHYDYWSDSSSAPSCSIRAPTSSPTA